MSKLKPMKILAIDPGTIHMGYAFLEGKNLLYYGVITFSGKGSNKSQLRTILNTVERFIQDFKPDALVVEKTYFAKTRSSPLLNIISDKIADLGRKQKLQVSQCAVNTVRSKLCGNGRASKQDVARVIVSKYPALKVFLNQDRRWKERFHANMFDAVALGCFYDNLLKSPK